MPKSKASLTSSFILSSATLVLASTVFASNSAASSAAVEEFAQPPIQLAGRYEDEKDDRRRMERMRRTGPSQAEVRGHDRKIEVRRRAARPIPRIKNKSRHKRYGYRGRPSHHSHSSHHFYHSVHVHHAHCGHSGWSHADEEWSHGDAFGSRTLGRSCIYGKDGEVIYKPADVICAPDEKAEEPETRPASAENSRKQAAQPKRHPAAVSPDASTAR